MGTGNTNNVSLLKDRHKGQDIFIVGSGKSVDYLPKDFFKGRLVVGVNHVYQRIPCDYVLSHHHEICQGIIDSGARLVTSVRDMCFTHTPEANLTGFYYTYLHLPQGFCKIDLSPLDNPEYLIAGGTIVTTAISFAYRIGARTIWLVGCDGGAIDDLVNYEDYPDPTNRSHFGNTQPQLREIATAVRERGVSVVSVNPWIDFGLEGHEFTL